jgi:hypothetical protein
MKKLALASAVALISAGAIAQPVATTGGIEIVGPPNLDITFPCGGTYSGGADGIVVDATAGTMAGTICMDPAGGAPYVMVSLSIGDTNGSPLSMEGGALQISTNWSVTSGWTPYNTITVTPANPINCVTLASPSNPSCSATLFGMPAILYLN